jgi:hypothetical protein
MRLNKMIVPGMYRGLGRGKTAVKNALDEHSSADCSQHYMVVLGAVWPWLKIRLCRVEMLCFVWRRKCSCLVWGGICEGDRTRLRVLALLSILELLKSILGPFFTPAFHPIAFIVI